MMRPLYLGLDIETTGLNQTDGDRIIELCASIYTYRGGFAKVKTITKRFNPERGIDPAAQAVHGIDLADLVGCPTFDSWVPNLIPALNKVGVVVAHNGIGFDLPFLFGEIQRCGHKLPEVNVIDTMLEARWATPDGSLPRLGVLCFAMGIDYDSEKAHSAEYDVDVMMQAFFQAAPTFISPEGAPYEFKPMQSKKDKRR